MKIGLLGHGIVGKGVREIIDAGATWEVRELSVKKILVKFDWELVDPRCTQDAKDILDDPEIDVVVECMGGIEPARTFCLEALAKGKHVVTSNKKMLANSCGELFACALAHDVAVHYEAACGGGIPWMASLDRTRRVDDIDGFRGIFNGTTNYILSEMASGGKSFAEMLKEAQSLGYAEKDPSDDIDGFDVKYKVALSCVKAFDVIPNIDGILTYGIRNIDQVDLAFCEKNGYACKLIGKAKRDGARVSAMVMPAFLRKEDVFSNIPLNFNCIESVSKTLGAATFVGQGAGSLPTAHAVVQNIVDIWKKQDPEINPKDNVIVDNSTYCGVFYIRSANIDKAASYVDKEAGECAVVTKRMTINELSEIVKDLNDSGMFVAEVAK